MNKVTMKLAKYRTISLTFGGINRNQVAMKALKIVLLTLVIIIGGACIWLATLPSQFEVRRETTINAPIEVVFGIINDFEEWKEWSPWSRRDSTLEITYGSITKGNGASYSWVGDPKLSGEGSMTITNSQPYDLMEFEIRMTAPYESNSSGYFRLEAVDGMTKVIWGNTGALSFFIRFIDMEKMLGTTLEDGLRFLREVSEAKSNAEPELSAEIVETDEIAYYYISADSVHAKDMGELFRNSFAEIMAYLAEDANNFTGHPFSISRAWNNELMIGDVDICLPIRSEKMGNERIKKATQAAGRAVRVTYYGNYNEIAPAYFAAEGYIEKNGLKYSGYPREIYVTDPEQEPDTSKWITYVEYPVE
jgi:effector-binding domain-containing protein/uncharacterized protein YndB with AHSA1/START domain